MWTCRSSSGRSCAFGDVSSAPRGSRQVGRSQISCFPPSPARCSTTRTSACNRHEGGDPSAAEHRPCDEAHLRQSFDSERRVTDLRERADGPREHSDHRRHLRSSRAGRKPRGGRSTGQRYIQPHPDASEASRVITAAGAKSSVFSGEPGGNRTPNPQIKSRRRTIRTSKKLSDSKD